MCVHNRSLFFWTITGIILLIILIYYKKPTLGYHFTTDDLMNIGKSLCQTLILYYNIKECKANIRLENDQILGMINEELGKNKQILLGIHESIKLV